MSFDAPERAAAERRLEKQRAARFRADVQAVFATVEGRRLLAEFLLQAGADASPLRTEPLACGHAIGWQDATRWWLEAIRQHCPERETQLRAEVKREAAQGAPQDPASDD